MRHKLNLVGENIAMLRSERGWTQDKLATKLQLLGHHITSQDLANIEARHWPVTDIQIVLFSEVLSVPINNLFPPVRFQGIKKLH
jgi:transcriptional regulator with XRE-family HTH domain